MVAGLEIGDRIVKVGGVDVERWEDMAQVIHRNPNAELALIFEREGVTKETTITPQIGRAHV